MIHASAPGKVVLWGEYAVLSGAPALVMAVDRYARCHLAPGSSAWHFSALGYQAPAETLTREQLLTGKAPERGAVCSTAWHALQVLDGKMLPAGGEVRLDTSSFRDHAGGGKLGLGSSAALCVATYAALCELLVQPRSYAAALEVHHRFQGEAGSGIDVAAAWHGGILKYRRASAGGTDRGEATAWALPPDLITTFVFSGVAARTTDHLERLRHWLDGGGGPGLDALAAASAALFETSDFFTTLDHYVAALWDFDQVANLGIFSEPHRRLRQLASDAGVAYKPCGAGGGDIGAGLTSDPAAAERFARLAAADGFMPLALEIAPHGLEVTG